MATNSAEYMRKRRAGVTGLCRCQQAPAVKLDGSGCKVCADCARIDSLTCKYRHYVRPPKPEKTPPPTRTRIEIMWEIDKPNNPPGWGTLQELEQRLEQIHG